MISIKSRITLIVGLIVLYGLHATSAYALDYYWSNPVSGSLLDPTMWTPNGVPQTLDTAVFNLGSTGYTVSLPPNNSGAQVARIIVGNDTVNADLGQNVLNVAETAGFTGGTTALILGNAKGDVANLKIMHGSIDLGSESDIGYAAGSTGTLTIDGSAGKASFSDANQYVGYAGNGSVAIVNGGTANIAQNSYLGYAAGTTGTITVDGAGSNYSAGVLSVGESGNGSISVTNGGTVLIGTSRFTVGDQVGSVGSVTVDGVGSSVGDIEYIGYQGSGSLSVTGGAKASGGYGGGFVGAMPGSSGTITVDGAGSSVSNLSIIGFSGSGSLTVTNGGTVQTLTDFEIGENSGGIGTVSLSGTGTSLNAGSTVLGRAGTGTLSLSSGAQMTTTSLYVGSNAATASGVTVDGAGTSLSAGAMTLRSSNVPTGIVTVTNGANLSVTSLDMGTTNTMTFDGQGTTGSIQGITSNPGDSLVIKNGAVLTTPGTYSSAYTISFGGTATVDGSGSAWNVKNLTTQSYSSGLHLTISNGGALNAQTMISDTPTNVLSGSSLTGSTSLTMESTLTVGANSLVSTPSLQIEGAVDLSGGGTIHVAPIVTMTQSVTPAVNPALPASTIQVDSGGVLTGLSTLTGSVLNDGGQVALINLQNGDSKNFNVSGDYTQTGGKLTLALAGAPENFSSELVVSGNVSLSGVLALDFVLPQIYKLHVGQTFDLISAGGSFSASNLTIEIASVPTAGQIPAGFAYTTQLSDGVYSLTITSVPEPASFVLAGLCFVGALPMRRLTSRSAGDPRSI